MVCIYCGNSTKVVNSRLKKRLNLVWRRRSCLKCKSTFTTLESNAYALSWIVRDKSSAITPFSRDKLFLSLYRSCEHLNSPIEVAGSITDTVIVSLLSKGESIIQNYEIKNACLVALNRLDKAAYSHYQAFHP